MGNCQAVDAAALVIQHPNGKMERMYWPIMASEVMKTNPGHYVSLIIPLPITGDNLTKYKSHNNNENSDHKTVRFSRVKLLRPNESLVLGRAYRLLTTQEVVKVLKAKKYAKTKTDSQKQSSGCEVEAKNEEMKNNQGMRNEKRRSTNLGAVRSKTWRPSLQSISESVS